MKPKFQNQHIAKADYITLSLSAPSLTHTLRLSALVALILGGAVTSAQAQNLHFDTTATSGLTPGTATWDLVTAAWQVSATPGVTAPGLWTDGNVAVFNTTAGTNTVTISGAVSAAGLQNGTNSAVTNISGGALTLTGNITVNGTGSHLTIANTTAVTLGSNQLVTVNTSPVVTINGDIGETGGARSLSKAGTGALTLAGNNTYTGGTTLAAGSLLLNSAGAIGSTGTITFGGGTLRSSANNTVDYSARISSAASQQFRFDTNGQNVTHSNALVSAGGSLIKSGGGTLTLGGASTLNGGYTISAGGLNLGGFTHTTSGTVALTAGTVSNGTFDNSGSYTSTGDSPVVSATLNGTAGLTRNGLNALQLTASNNYSGGTTLTSGEVRISTVGSLGTGAVSFNGGTLGLGASIGTPVANTMSATGTNNYRFDSNSFTATYSATLAGLTNGVVKTNAGTIILTSAHSSYGGVTSVLRGTLTVNTLANGGANSGIGSSSNAASNLIIGAGGSQGQSILRYAGATNASTDRLFTISNATGSSAAVESSGDGTLAFTNSGSIAFTGTALTARTFILGGSNLGDNSFALNISDGDAATSFSKQGAGKWILTNATNSFTGRTEVSSGTLSVSSLANGGSASNIGASSNAAANLVLGASTTLLYTGAAVSTDRLFTLNSTSVGAAFTLDASGSGAVNFTNNGAVVYAGTTNQTRTLNLRGTNTGDNTLAALIGNNGTGVTTLSKQDAGTWLLSGANTYTGVTSVSAGTLAVGNIANGGVASALGASSNAATNLVLGNATTLRYTGAAASTDRRFIVNGTAGGHGAKIEASGSGAIDFTNATGPAWGSTNQTRTLTLGGTNTGDNKFSGAIANNGTGAVSVTKADAGTWLLSAVNTYTGATSVSAGTLIVNGNISTSTLTTVNGTGTIGGSGTVGDLTIATGGTHNPGNSPGIMNTGDYIMAGSLNIEVTGNTPGVGGYDQVNVAGTINLSGVLNTSFTAGTYAAGDLLFILLNDGSDAVSGTFSGLAQNALVANSRGFNWNISYTANSTNNTFTGGNDVALMAIPEPSVAMLIGLAMLTPLRRRRN